MLFTGFCGLVNCCIVALYLICGKALDTTNALSLVFGLFKVVNSINWQLSSCYRCSHVLRCSSANRRLVKYHKVEWWLKYTLLKAAVTCFYFFPQVSIAKKKHFQRSSFQFIYQSVFQSVLCFSHVHVCVCYIFVVLWGHITLIFSCQVMQFVIETMYNI